ncbi:ABC transporter ATP-binding protein [Mucilaginibacter sp. HC2]|uniref:ABC transporter ATP-binding protein n=1 Tax=Mucilaginibacter inviolabilis TaxID=2714892 RepID=UPI00140D3D15|nr:ABC transporter ATP-binding protein [Mucilaginibacter inviolabilis]NHA04937.1 ABC transporter ATP-binding protein [Mucilaginibacter inviolabilis]
MSTVIKVENLSKAYQLGDFGTGTISRDLERYWARIRGKEDPFLKIGETNDRTTKGGSDVVWSLRDINFDIEQGDAVGIIGRNGAGKSTLLKILSRVTSPTAGSVKVKGRIASLLEVGTGFHPELTGKENIFLNGAILGMRKTEIKRKFDEIVDFSGVERYIDTPVKRYSSGMYVRLAFAVAAHLESEILIIDEVLAVGDAEFQKKCLGKIGDVSKGEGRTVLFVSHNMGAVQKLCNNAILLHNGIVNAIGNSRSIISSYLTNSALNESVYDLTDHLKTNDLPGYAYRLQIEDTNANIINEIAAGQPWQVRVYFTINKRTDHFIIALNLMNAMDVNLRTTWSKETDLEKGNYEAVFTEDTLMFSAGTYNLTLGLSSYEKSFQYIENVASFTISQLAHESLDKSIIRLTDAGILINQMNIKITHSV